MDHNKERLSKNEKKEKKMCNGNYDQVSMKLMDQIDELDFDIRLKLMMCAIQNILNLLKSFS